MNKIVLPPGPTPRSLTAKSALRTLLEHQLAFINANNKSGFLETDHLDDDQIAGIATDLLAMAKLEVVNIRDINRMVDKSSYQVLDENGEPRMKRAITFKTMARLLGYSNHNSLKYYANPEGFIVNRRNAISAEYQIFQPSQKALLGLVKKPNNKTLKKQTEAYQCSSETALTQQEQERCEVLAQALLTLDSTKGIELFKRDDTEERRGRMTFSKQCKAYAQYATPDFKAMVDWIWNEINDLVYIHSPLTGEPATLDKRVIAFLEGVYNIHITKTTAFSVRNINVTVTLGKIRFIFKPYTKTNHV